MNDAEYIDDLERTVLLMWFVGNSELVPVELFNEIGRRHQLRASKPELECDIYNPLGKDTETI